ncbi:craniofacial development protein 2-like, partial [Palaemon carinicauda]|uniref:craniofacial development protein 2-like n=1 Tax=Palaemon carinicauda TaxID=392227 RepID=UPI0035B601E8
MSIIICYAPTNDSPEERKDEYCEELQSVIDEIPEIYMKIVTSNFNAEVGMNSRGIDNVMGVESLGEIANENGANFISFCSTNNLVIRGNLFQHKNIHKYALTSPWDIYKNQVDHMVINKERRRTLRNVRRYI